MLKETIQQEDITLLNIYTPNIGAPKYIKKILMAIKGETDRNTVLVREVSGIMASRGHCPISKPSPHRASKLMAYLRHHQHG